jgi:cell division protein FtsL
VKHSFIVPRRKRLVSGELKLVLFFFTVTIVMVVGTYLFLGYKTYDFINERNAIAKKEIELKSAIEKMEEDIHIIESEAKIAEQVSTENMVMKESIRNLFDLVPEEITLSSAELEAKSLILYGTTPNKETYEYMLQAPLRSIFHRTYTSFYPIENGWYRFVSTNYLDDETEQKGEE